MSNAEHKTAMNKKEEKLWNCITRQHIACIIVVVNETFYGHLTVIINRLLFILFYLCLSLSLPSFFISSISLFNHLILLWSLLCCVLWTAYNLLWYRACALFVGFSIKAHQCLKKLIFIFIWRCVFSFFDSRDLINMIRSFIWLHRKTKNEKLAGDYYCLTIGFSNIFFRL